MIDPDKLPVYAKPRDEFREGDKPDGFAADKQEAAKIIRSETGDNDYRARDVFFSAPINAYFAEE
jgi:hypothetical protein